MSHEAMLAGKHCTAITVGAGRRRSTGDVRLTELEFYDVLSNNFLLTDEQLVSNGFPMWDTEKPGFVKIALNQLDSKKKTFHTADGIASVLITDIP
jgi:hypothetical protein